MYLVVMVWLVSHGCDYWREPGLSVEDGSDGPCLKIVVPDGIRTVVSSDVVKLSPGHPVRISCRQRLPFVAVRYSFTWRSRCQLQAAGLTIPTISQAPPRLVARSHESL